VAPHPLLSCYYADERQRQKYLADSFGATAPHYDGINRWMSFWTDRWYRRQALLRAGLAAGMDVADVGCGTGIVSEMAGTVVGRRGHVVSIDPSAAMMAEAVAKGRVAAPIIGRAEALPLGSGTADFLCMAFALRHVADLRTTFREYLRVLRPGGRLLLMEMTPPPRGALRHLLKGYMRYVVPAITRVTTGSGAATTLYAYCWDTFENCVPPEVILDALGEAGFECPSRHVVARIFSEYTARKPLKAPFAGWAGRGGT
jgi:demethylmenaquinone methyltransferase/2-methoxy-6-polyprenyl-1,4-benzoquinol methylase